MLNKYNVSKAEILPLVSVIMPNYNTPESYLRSAIESVLEQTYPNIEFIIIDDASTGNDIDIINSYQDARIRLILNETNRHVAYTLNRGMDAAGGEFIARMDSDDICLPRRIEKQVAFLQRHPDIDILCGQARYFGDRSGVFAPHLTNAAQMKTELFFCCPVVHPSVMFRASFIQQHRLRYKDSPDYRAAEDYELWSRCAGIGRICEYPRVLLRYRAHSRQISAASGGKQLEGTRRIRAVQLSLLGITPNEREALIHDLFSTESASADIPLGETENWACRLLEASRQCHIFPQRYFKMAIVQRYFVIAVKSLLKRGITFKQLMRLSLTHSALSPAYLWRYFKRFMFSKRFNRVINK